MQNFLEDIIIDESNTLSDGTQDDDEYTPNQKRTKRKRNQNRVKISHTWSHEDIVKLITEVETRPALWNVGHVDYKNRNKRDSAWQEVYAIFVKKIPVEELTTKWQNLRTQYRTAKANAKKTKSGQAASDKPHWKYYSQMDFVGAAEQNQTVQSVSNIIGEDMDDSVAAVSGSSSSGNSGVAFRKRKADQTSTTVNIGEETSNKEETLLAGMQMAMDRLQQKKPADDIQTFGHFLVSELRKVKSPSYRQSTQRKLLQLLWDCIDKQPVHLLFFFCLLFLFIFCFDLFFFVLQMTLENVDVVVLNPNGTIAPATYVSTQSENS